MKLRGKFILFVLVALLAVARGSVAIGYPQLISQVSLGSGAADVAVDSLTGRVYVAIQPDSLHNEIQVRSPDGVLLDTIPVGTTSLAIDPPHHRLFAGLTEINTNTDAVVGTVPPFNGAGSGDILFDSANDTLYYLLPFNHEIKVINPDTLTVENTISTPYFSIALALDPSRNRAYAANPNEIAVSVVDLTTNSVSSNVGIGDSTRVPWELAVNPVTGLIYTGNIDTAAGILDGSVSVIDFDHGNAVAQVPMQTQSLGGEYNRSIAVDAIHNLLYVGDDNMIVQIDESTNQVLDRIQPPNGTGINAFAFNSNGGRVYAVDDSQFLDILAEPGVGGAVEMTVGHGPVSPPTELLFLLAAAGVLAAAAWVRRRRIQRQ